MPLVAKILITVGIFVGLPVASYFAGKAFAPEEAATPSSPANAGVHQGATTGPADGDAAGTADIVEPTTGTVTQDGRRVRQTASGTPQPSPVGGADATPTASASGSETPTSAPTPAGAPSSSATPAPSSTPAPEPSGSPAPSEAGSPAPAGDSPPAA